MECVLSSNEHYKISSASQWTWEFLYKELTQAGAYMFCSYSDRHIPCLTNRKKKKKKNLIPFFLIGSILPSMKNEQKHVFPVYSVLLNFCGILNIPKPHKNSEQCMFDNFIPIL